MTLWVKYVKARSRCHQHIKLHQVSLIPGKMKLLVIFCCSFIAFHLSIAASRHDPVSIIIYCTSWRWDIHFGCVSVCIFSWVIEMKRWKWSKFLISCSPISGKISLPVHTSLVWRLFFHLFNRPHILANAFLLLHCIQYKPFSLPYLGFLALWKFLSHRLKLRSTVLLSQWRKYRL